MIWLTSNIYNKSINMVVFLSYDIFLRFFCMSSKLKALHCWNILLPFWFKGWPWCFYIYLHLENLYFFGLIVSPDSGLPLYVRESSGIFWTSDFLSFLFTLEATGRRLQWPKKLKNKSLWMIYSSILRNEYCFVLKSQSCIPWKNLKYLRHFQELCFQLD